MARDAAERLRRAILGLFVLGSTGTLIELVLIGHDEDVWQYAPLIVITLALVAAAAGLGRPSAATQQAFRAVMGLFVLSGLAGIWLHYAGAAEFQREIDPSMDRWALTIKVLRAKAPPVLAPGLMIQLGLLGFVWSFRSKDGES